MSLTEKIKNPNSKIYIWFNENFDFKKMITEKNNEIKNARTLLPSSEIKYPWSTVGHVTEYLLALELEINLIELYPMRYLKAYHYNEFNKLAFNYYVYANTKENIINGLNILYKLALYESEIRQGHNVSIIPDVILDSHVKSDLLNIFSLFENKFPSNAEFIYNPHFNGYLTEKIGGADADLIECKKDGGILLDLKTTKKSKIDKYMLCQLIGYAALDIENEFNLKKVGLFLTRQDIIIDFDLDLLISDCSKFNSFLDCRKSFYNLIVRN